MAPLLNVSASRSIPVSVEAAYDAVLPMPLPLIFNRRYAVLPPIREVRDQEGVWGTVGQTRTILLADGGIMHETLVSVTPSSGFAYRIRPTSGMLKPLVREVEGRWNFFPAGTGVEVTWAWTVRPSAGGALLMPVFGRMWHGYARQALEEIEKALLGH